MTDADVSVLGPGLLQYLTGFAMDPQERLAFIPVQHFYIGPSYALSPPGSQCFQSGLFSRKSAGIVLVFSLPATAVFLFPGSKYTAQQGRAASQGAFNSLHLDDVDPDPNNHAGMLPSGRMFLNKIVARHHVFTFTELEQIPGFVHLIVGRPSPPNRLDAKPTEKVAYLPPYDVLSAAGISGSLLVPLQQVHSDRTIVLDGSGDGGEPLQHADGIIALKAEVCPIIRTADCVPVIAVAPRQRAFGIFHAGWRGTCSRIVEKGIHRLLQSSGARPEELVVALGPAIRKCCYEIGSEVEAEFREEGHEIQRFANNGHLDLLEANRIQLLSVGINRILDSGLCTACHPELFYSYRHDRTRGRMWTFGAFRR